MLSIKPTSGWDGDTKQPPRYVYDLPVRDRVIHIQCKICDRGALIPRTKFRMSPPVVAIGFLLLIPSVVGIAGSLAILGASASLGSATHQGPSSSARNTAVRNLLQYDVPRNVINAVVVGDERAIDNWLHRDINTHGRVTYMQEEAVRRAQAELRQDSSGSHIEAAARLFGGVSSVVLGLISFVGGLLGWLLVMRKRVLQCGLCGAVVGAS